MKNLILILLVSFLYSNSYGQKKKAVVKKNVATSVLAKTDNLTAEIIKNNFYLFINNGKKKDTIIIKSVDNKIIPTDCKIVAFSAKAKPLYLLTWIEKSTLQSPTKKEDITYTYSEIYEITSKTKSFSNMQTATKITEQVFLDKLKNASETQERLRNEGFVFTLTKDGDIMLNTKKQENKMTFDIDTKKYIDIKKKK